MSAEGKRDDSGTPQSWQNTSAADRTSSNKDASSSNASSSDGDSSRNAEDEEFEAAMGQAWNSLRKQLRQTLPREQAELLEDMSLEVSQQA